MHADRFFARHARVIRQGDACHQDHDGPAHVSCYDYIHRNQARTRIGVLLGRRSGPSPALLPADLTGWQDSVREALGGVADAASREGLDYLATHGAPALVELAGAAGAPPAAFLVRVLARCLASRRRGQRQLPQPTRSRHPGRPGEAVAAALAPPSGVVDPGDPVAVHLAAAARYLAAADAPRLLQSRTSVEELAMQLAWRETVRETQQPQF